MNRVSKIGGLYVLLIIISITNVLNAQNQRVGYRDLAIKETQVVELELKKEEHLLYPNTWSAQSPLSMMQTLSGGYILGNNHLEDVEHGQVYSMGRNKLLSGVYIGVHALGNMKGVVRIRVRSFGRLPGQLLGEVVWSVDSLSEGVKWQKLEFPKKILLQGSVIISLDVSDLESGQIGLMSQRTKVDQIWTKTSERKWLKQEILWNKPPLVATLFPVMFSRASFADGSGTRDDPYQIASPEQLDAVRDFLSSHFVQVADIDIGVSPWNEGEGWAPLGSATEHFTGSYNGGGFRISGLTIDRQGTDFQGLFGLTTGAHLWNLDLEGASLIGGNYTGILTGRSLGGEIINVEVNGVVEGHNFAGGITGEINRGWIRDCISSVQVGGESHVGGVAGSGQISSCMASGNITGVASSFRLGGVLGEGLAINSKSTGAVTGGSELGGGIGRGEAFGCQATGAVKGSGDFVGGLIGELTPSRFSEADTEYGAGETVAGDSAKLMDSLNLPGSGRIEIVLEDGTRFVLEGNGSEMEAVASRLPVDFNLSDYIPEWEGFRITGSMRELKVTGAGNPSGIKPIISIPIQEIGSVNPETVVVLRIGDLNIDGELLVSHGMILPIITIADGKLKFLDASFPECVVPADEVEGSAELRVDTWVGNVKYILLTYDNSLNWSKAPRIERMIPDTLKTSLGYRHWIGRASKSEKLALIKKPVCNIILLVHGHNELEKDGYVPPSADNPWEVGYKRLLWELLYSEFQKNGIKDLPDDCTSFYEFIYPTYRPIFSPVLEKSDFRMSTLGEDLGRMVNDALLQDQQIKKMLEENMEFNLYVVAHSQGGLVSRAGFRFMDERLLRKLKKVITWGSPHGGAGLYSLLYALTVGHDIVIDGIRFPLQNIGKSKAYQNEISGIAIDAPGIRDLRWDVSKKEMLRLGDLLQENPSTLDEFPNTELPYGGLFFSDNLKIFNESEGSGMNGLLQDKYFFYQGITSKLAELEAASLYFIWQFYRFATKATSIEKGAQLNRLVMNDPYKDNDGAAPVNSQGANFVYFGGGIQRRLFQDVDHEEFYGSEEPQRNETTKAKGIMIARETFTDLGLRLPKSRCPKLEWQERTENDSLKFDGNFLYPVYDIVQGGDGKPGKRIREFQARPDGRNTPSLTGIIFTVAEDGQWSMALPLSILNSVQDSLFIVAVLKDGSEVFGGIKVDGNARVFNRTLNKWYGGIQAAVSEARSGDTILVKQGIYKESISQVSIFDKDLKIWSYDGPANTILESPSPRQYNGFIVSRGIEIKGFSFRNYKDGIILSGSFSGENYPKTIRENKFENCERAIHTTQIEKVDISDNEFINNETYAISIFRDYYATFSDKSFTINNNRIDGVFQGIRLRENLQLPPGADPFRVDISDNYITNCSGPGIYLSGNIMPEIVNNTINHSQATGLELNNLNASSTTSLEFNTLSFCLSGIYLGGYGHYQIHSNTVVSSIETGISVLLENGSANFTQNVFDGNSSGGVVQWPSPALSLQTGSNPVTIISNQFFNNKAGGIHVLSGSNVSIRQNTFTGNEAEHGGAIKLDTEIISLQSNVFQQNRAADGGAIFGWAQQISENQFINNYATNRGGAIYGGQSNWPVTATVTVAGQVTQVPRYVPCFPEATNTYSGNSHGNVLGAWGPGADNWCPDSGHDVFFD